MGKKTKYIILGTTIIAIIVTVVLVFTLGEDEVAETENQEEIQKTSEDKLRQASADLTQVFENSYEDLKVANNKGDLKKIYKNVVGNLLDNAPDWLSLSQDYIDEYYDGNVKKFMSLESQEAEAEKYGEEYGKMMTLFAKYSALMSDQAWLDKMEGIAETVDEDDLAELINFTFDKGTVAFQDIANDDKSLKYFNVMAKEFMKGFSGDDGFYQKDLTKEDLLSAVKEAKANFDGVKGSDIEEMINDIFGGPQYPDYDGDDYYYGN